MEMLYQYQAERTEEALIRIFGVPTEI